MCHKILQDARLPHALLRIDLDLSARTREKGCHCGAALHSAVYPRKPRGGIENLGPEHALQYSFCCSREGCRQRTKPPSVRFLGRRVYLGIVVVLVSAMRGGINAQRAARLHEALGVDVRTLERWRAWWREEFPVSLFWKVAMGLLPGAVDPSTLPATLLACFEGTDQTERLVAALLFLSPLNASPPRSRFPMGT